MARGSYCPGCFEKQRKIDQLLEENQNLKEKLRYQERKAQEGFFGSSTPSSKIPLKPDQGAERKPKGAKAGHKGAGQGAQGGGWGRGVPAVGWQAYPGRVHAHPLA